MFNRFQLRLRVLTMSFAFLVCLIASSAAYAQGTAFTYQGRLTDAGNPADGVYDFQFKLFATQALGTELDSTTNPSVQVTNGVFTVQLDFGACATCFNGSARFLEIGVRPAGSADPHIILAPRQPVTATPYAIRSSVAAAADGLSVSCVNCVTSSQIQSVAGSQVSGGAGITNLNASNLSSGTLNNARLGVVPIANGGTGSATQNFVDLTNFQTIGGSKTFSTRLLVSTGSSGATPAASADLVVEDNIAAFQHFLTPDDIESGILFGDGTDSIAGGIVFNNGATNNGIQFRTGGNTTRMTLDGSGNLGIAGTFSVIGNSSSASTPVSIFQSAGSQVPLAFRSGGSEVARVRADSQGNLVLATLNGTDKDIYFRAGDDSGTDMFIQSSSGNVGIGTSSPDAKLDVNGNIQVTGEVRRPATGTANMLPLCYGHVLEDGTIVSGSGNFSVATSQGSTTHVISVPGEDFGAGAHAYTVLVQVRNNTDPYIATTSTLGGNLVVIIRAADGSSRQADFSFVIYKP